MQKKNASADAEATAGGGKLSSLKTEVIEWVKLAAIVLVVGLFVRTFLFQVIRVEGPSMEDTLFTNEYMFVGRLAYRIGEPERGDVVICHYPDNRDDYVKRLVGVPGDTLEVRGGVLFRNGRAVDEPYVVHPSREDCSPVTLQEDEYMVYGDNRTNSLDGRVLGPLPKSGLKGRVNAIIWPLSKLHRVTDGT